jgi:hypothetical protein
MPAPNRAPDELLWLEAPAPVCLAWFRSSLYSLAAGEPGSTWTPGGTLVVAARAEVAEQLTRRAAAKDTATERTTVKIVPALPERGGRVGGELCQCRVARV